MPYRSDAQRRFFHSPGAKKAGITATDVKRWDDESRGKKLPEKVKAAAFLDELRKIAEKNNSPFSKVTDFVSNHPYASAALAAAPVAGGVLAKGLLSRAPASGSALLKRMRGLAQKEGLGYQFSLDPGQTVPKLKDKLQNFLYSGGSRNIRPIYTKSTSINKVVPASIDDVGKGVTMGLDRPPVPSKADISYHGGQSTHGLASEKVRKAIDEVILGGKSTEAKILPSLGGRTMSAAELAKKHGIRIPKEGASPVEIEEYVAKMQQAGRKEFSSGFLLKPHGISSSVEFPTEKGSWADLHRQYTTELEPQMNALRDQALAAPDDPKVWGAMLGDPVENLMVDKFQKHPAYTGMATKQLHQSPKHVVFQEKLPVAKGVPEYRVHVVGGEVPDEMVVNKSVKQHLLQRAHLGKLLPSRVGAQDQAAEWVRQNVVPRLPKTLRKGTFGLDVVRVQNPDGSFGHKLIEMNPSGVSNLSGYMDPQINPMIAQDAYKWLTGKDTPLMATAKAVGAGGALGMAALPATLAVRRHQAKKR